SWPITTPTLNENSDQPSASRGRARKHCTPSQQASHTVITNPTSPRFAQVAGSLQELSNFVQGIGRTGLEFALVPRRVMDAAQLPLTAITPADANQCTNLRLALVNMPFHSTR